MEIANKIGELLQKLGERNLLDDLLDDPYETISKLNDNYLLDETSKFLDEREKDGIS